tara:strand:- start:186 stop:503 length:318 start_codon:yes stop_codon:yes gene_type:complete
MKLDLHTYVLMQMLDGVPTVFATRSDGINCQNTGAFWEKKENGDLLDSIYWRADINYKYDDYKWSWMAEVQTGFCHDVDGSTFKTSGMSAMDMYKSLEATKTKEN